MSTDMSKPGRSRKASAHIGVLLAGGALFVAGIGWTWTYSFSSSSAPIAITSLLPTTHSGSISATLLRAGLTPQALTAAGANNGDITSVATAVRAVLDEQQGTLDTADAALLAAQGTIERLERLVQSGQASSEDHTALTAARSSKATAVTNRDAVLNAVFTAAAGTLTSEKSTALTQIRANGGVSAPMQYRLASRSDADWLAIRNAAANTRIAAQQGCAADGACVSLMATVNAEPATVAAATRLAESLATNITAWKASAAPMQ